MGYLGLDTWISILSNYPMFGYMDSWISHFFMYPDTWIHGYLDIMDTWILGYLNFGQPKKLGYPSIRISKYPDTTSLLRSLNLNWYNSYYTKQKNEKIAKEQKWKYLHLVSYPLNQSDFKPVKYTKMT